MFWYENELICNNRVLVLLPHIAGRNTVEAFLEKTQVAANNILAVLNNEPMPCKVNL